MWLDNKTFRTIVASTPLISIDFFIQNNAGEVFLGRRVNRPAQGLWFVPGGRILKNETLDTAFRRLSQEELGNPFERSDSRLLGVYEHFYEDTVFDESDETSGTHYVVLAYHLLLDSNDKLHPGNSQHNFYHWWTLDEAQTSKEIHSNTSIYFKDFANLFNKAKDA